MKKNKNKTDFQLAESHIWLPYTQMQNHLPQLEVVGAKGSEIYLKDDKKLIDGVASWWCVAHGYQNSYIKNALKKQLENLSHIMLAGFANQQTYKLAHRLCKFSKMDHVFFSDSGSTAVEVAMKISWQFYINCSEVEKTKFISFKNSYHGDTTGAMSLADLSSGMHKKFEKILLKNFSLELPKNQKDLHKFEKFLAENHAKIAGIFIEPLVQCAGGMKFSSAAILKEIHRLSNKYNILFIADECAVGFYRLGKKFSCDFANIKPDILILGKALTGGFLTLAATLVNKNIYQKFLGASLDLALMHGPTFMGNPLACAAANASLDLFEKNNYAKKVSAIEKILSAELEKCRSIKKVNDVRIFGAIGVVEIDLTLQEIFSLRKEFIKHGIFLRPFSNVIYVMPALTISSVQLKKITNSIFTILSKYHG